MRHLKKLPIVSILLLWTTIAVLAQEACPTIVQTALQTTEQSCAGINRNQACYGHVAISAEAKPEITSFTFNQSGDIVNVGDLQSMALSPLDTSAGAWGVAMLRIQANLPDTLPGQNVTVLVFGDTQIVNAGENLVKLPATIATSGDNLNVRLAPGTSATPIGSVANGQAITVSGRTEAGDWLLVEGLDAGSGWAAAQFVTVDGDVNSLSVVAPNTPHYGPMQAFYMRTGIGQPECAEMPANGVMVQGPSNGAPVQLTINQVNVEFASTLYFQAAPGKNMVINLLDGAARVEADGVAQPLVEGGYVTVPLNDDLTVAGEPSEYQPYDESDFENLPIDQLGHPAEIADSASDEDAHLVNEYADYFDAVSIEDYDDLYDFMSEDDEFSDDELYTYVEDELDPYEDIGGDSVVSDNGIFGVQSDVSGEVEGGESVEGETGIEGTGEDTLVDGDVVTGEDTALEGSIDGENGELTDGAIVDDGGDLPDDGSGDDGSGDGKEDGSGEQPTDDSTLDDGSVDDGSSDDYTDDSSTDDYVDDGSGDYVDDGSTDDYVDDGSSGDYIDDGSTDDYVDDGSGGDYTDDSSTDDYVDDGSSDSGE